MLTLESPWILNRIADASLKSAAILAAAATVVFLLRRRSAALRHWVWLVALIGTVALPLVSPLAPSWRVRMPASWRAANAATVATTVNASQPPAGNQDSSSPAETASVERELSGTEIPAAGSTNEPTTDSRMAPEARSGALTADVRETSGVANWLCGIWALGAATIALRWLAGLASVRSLERHAVRLVTAQWRPVFERAAAALKLRRHVTLCESTRVETPLTWGTWRAVIALPMGHTEWPAEQLRAVLVHELAHVKRRDCLAQLLAQVACALYWFHPLVWLAARQLRMEAERACDDCALSDGTPGADYASYLVAVARAGRSARGATIVAIAFTRTSRLERRVRAVLDVTVGRQPVSPVTAVTIAFAAIVCFPPLAAVRPTVKGEEPEARPTASPPDSDQHEQTSVARQTLSVWGTVVGADGQPVAGATVYLREAPMGTKSDLHSVPTRNLAQTLTDAVGSFEFRDLLVAKPSSPRKFIFPLEVIATAPDAGLAWRRVKAPPSTSLRLTLAAGQTVRGRLVEPNGRPAAGVNVKVREISALDDPIHRTLGSMRHVDLESSEVSFSALTDADGQFSLGGLPPAVRATLWIDDERYVPQDI
ncbi:MAG TPA: M56 family metallopeptidase, partial [Pirellulales bacterium]|nr:M56 family metallopeptidase [Pirellulales bacterium]